jgi:hypothetical protein
MHFEVKHIMGMLPGKDRKVVGIPAPSTRAKARAWINKFVATDRQRQRGFLGSRK